MKFVSSSQLNSWDSHWTRGSLSSPLNIYKERAAYAFVDEIYRQLTQSEPTNIIDLGCGNGSHLIPIRDAFGECHYVGIDISASALDLFRKEHNLINGIGITKLVHGDINKVNLSNLMHPHSNIIISFGVIAYCLDPFAWLARIDLFSVDKIFIYVVTSETLASKSLIILRCLYHSMPSLFSSCY